MSIFGRRKTAATDAPLSTEEGASAATPEPGLTPGPWVVEGVIRDGFDAYVPHPQGEEGWIDHRESFLTLDAAHAEIDRNGGHLA